MLIFQQLPLLTDFHSAFEQAQMPNWLFQLVPRASTSTSAPIIDQNPGGGGGHGLNSRPPPTPVVMAALVISTQTQLYCGQILFISLHVRS